MLLVREDVPMLLLVALLGGATVAICIASRFFQKRKPAITNALFFPNLGFGFATAWFAKPGVGYVIAIVAIATIVAAPSPPKRKWKSKKNTQ